MRPLTEEETKTLFEKLSKYIGEESIKRLIDRSDGVYCFRLHKVRVYYVSEEIMKRAANLARSELICLGTCFGKFTKTGKFRLHITALDYLAPYAPFKIWLKSSSEQGFLYGKNVVKSGLGRITENTEKYQGVVVYNMSDLPLGFGVAARSTAECRHADPMTVVCFHQADIGEYIRSEDTIRFSADLILKTSTLSIDLII
uniref:60S ribosome subunit biogenesis protein NIP7 homolog n=2 Tax=Lepeophtheirus salmonis TaxID=72036 RepID=C1BRW9_LEPSM|nr:60S ribosome subunit biogenesis protein NIP7 homolog [Lepeophtheirus salmonis]